LQLEHISIHLGHNPFWNCQDFREWSMAKPQFAVIFGERFIKAMAA
jgi:hypothetical protein